METGLGFILSALALSCGSDLHQGHFLVERSRTWKSQKPQTFLGLMS